MNINNYEVKVINLNLNYYDNRVDNEFAPYDQTGCKNNGTSNFRNLINNATPLTNCRLNMNDIYSGTILVPSISTTYDTIVLNDKRTNWNYCYFISETGRMFNELVEYRIDLNYFATYGEIFLFNNWTSCKPLWHKMEIYKSNQVPIPASYWDSSSTALVNPDVQKWTWLNNSCSELPQDLIIDNNNEMINRYVYNVFNSTFVTGNNKWNYVSMDGYQRWDTNTSVLNLSRVQVRASGISKSYSVVYAKNYYNFNVSTLPSKWQGRAVNFINSQIPEGFTYWDAEYWLLASPTLNWWENNHEISNWEGTAGPGASHQAIIAIPLYKRTLNLMNKIRFGGANLDLMGITKFKAQNFLQNQGPNAVVLMGSNDLGLGSGGYRDDLVVPCPILEMETIPHSFDVAPFARNVGWYNRVRIALSTFKPTRAFASAPKTWEEATGVMRLVSGYTKCIISTGASWMVYDWTAFNAYNFDIFYSNMGYEYIWLEPNFDINNPWKATTIRPWKENKLSLGLQSVRETNLRQFNSKAMDTIISSANQWQVGQNQAQYNFEQSKKRYEVNLVDQTLGLNPLMAGKNLMNMFFNPGKLANMEMNLDQAKINAEYDTKKLPAMYQDLMKSNTGSYPAGQSYLIEWEVPSLWLVEWNVDFIANVYNYVTKNGWYNNPTNWNNGDLAYTYSSAIFTRDSSNNYIISGYYCFAKFRRNLNQVARNVRSIASYLGIRLGQRVVEWFADWMDKGIRIWYSYDGTRETQPKYTIQEMTEIAKSKIEVIHNPELEHNLVQELVNEFRQNNKDENQNQEPKSRKSRSSTNSKRTNARTSKTNIKS